MTDHDNKEHDDNADLVLRFADAINKRDIPALTSLMTDDHVFVDSLGNEVEGRETVIEAWRSYFAMMPEYEIEDDWTMGDPYHVVLFGIARGVYAPDGKMSPERRWSTPAAWRAEICYGKIAEWRVYADNKPVYDLMATDASASR